MKTKKLISAILLFMFIFALMPFNSAAADTEDIVIKVLVEPSLELSQNNSPYPFYDGIAVVFNKNDEYGVINKTGKMIVPFGKYDVIASFSEGLAAVGKDIGEKTGIYKWGFIDTTGKVIVPLEYNFANNFSEGLAIVANGNWIDNNIKCGYVDKTGKVVIPLEYDYNHSFGDFSDGLALVAKNNKFGYIDKTGKVVIPLEYYNARDFSDGFAAVNKDGKGGYINKEGKVVIPLEYDNTDSFSEGFAIVQLGYFADRTGKSTLSPVRKIGVIDKIGKIIVPFGEYDIICPFSDGLAMALDGGEFSGFANLNYEDGKYGYINKTGKLAVPLEYDNANSFSEGRAKVVKDGKCGYIDKTGKVIVPLEYDDAWDFSEGLAKMKKDNKCGYIDKTGRVVLPLEYDSLTDFHDGIAWVQKDGKWGIIQMLSVGYPIGAVLYSDITAYINGEAIPTSVINGKTLVVVEDLAKYGFDVKWDGSERTLKVEQNKNKTIKPIPTEKDTTNKPGTFKCNYLYTDIKTYLSGEEVGSYAINGVTLIDFELLAKYGKLTWDGKAKEIRIVTNDKLIVFWGKTGDRVHIDPDCRTFSLAVNSGTLDEARAAKRDGWCSVCSGGWNDERLLKEGNPNAQKFYADKK